MATSDDNPTNPFSQTVADKTHVEPTKVGLYGVEHVDQFVGPYRILALLGQGGQGAVYRAEDRRAKRIVALKVLRSPGFNAGEMVRRFRREAEVTAKLEHPSICPIYEVGVDDAVPFIAMRLVEGKTLAQLISDTKTSAESHTTGFLEFASGGDCDSTNVMTPAERDRVISSRDARGNPKKSERVGRDAIRNVLQIVERAARALHAAHDAGVIHRDIKPANIMVQKDGTPVILDFGLAYEEDHIGPSLSMTGQLMGTPAYMAPEQVATSDSRVDRRADVYSLGVTLFECLTLRRPFDGPTRSALFDAITEKEPPAPRSLNPSIPPDAAIVILKALEKDPDVRFPTALAFADELRRVLAHEPILTRPVGPLGRHGRWMMRNPGWAVALYGIVVALAAAAVIFYVKNAEAEKNAEAARENAERAEKESEAKSLALDAYDRLADTAVFAKALQEESELYPIAPGLVAAIESWRARHADLFARLAIHEKTLVDLQKKAAPYGEKDRAEDYPADHRKLREIEMTAERLRAAAKASPGDQSADDAAIDAEDAAKSARKSYLARPQRSADFGDEAKLQFQYDALAKLVFEMRAFLDPETGRVKDLDRRLAESTTIRERTIVRHRSAWDEAIARIGKNPKYDGLRLQPQVGLIPLGPDRDTTLEEFYETETGAPPVRDAEGKISIADSTAIVFVLVPGGEFSMGAQKLDKNGPNYDSGVFEDESPVHRVALDAFFLSKFEMTQGQWSRTSRSLKAGERPNPSNWQTGNNPTYSWSKTDLRRPIDMISWDMAHRRLEELGHRLPTEAQWEYACRGGTTTPWASGLDSSSVESCANLADKSYHKDFLLSPYDATIDDGGTITLAVGSKAPNGFGLFDMLGNVLEWCEDGYALYGAAPHRPGDGLREIPYASARVLRGGAFNSVPAFARSAARSRYDAPNRFNNLGFRPARAVTSD